MKLLLPNDIPPENVISTNASDPTPLWDQNAQYVVGDKVQHNLKIWQALEDNSGVEPGTDATIWDLYGYANPYKFLDNYNNTFSENDDILEFEVLCGDIDGLSLIGIMGQKVTIDIYEDRTNLVFSQTYSMTSSLNIIDYYDWFFADQLVKDTITLILPKFYDTKIHIKIENQNYKAKLGTLLAGKAYYLGTTLVDPHPTANMLSYSKKFEDDFGRTYLDKGNSTYEMELKIVVDDYALEYVMYVSMQAEGRRAMFVGDETHVFGNLLNIYGYLKEFDIEAQKVLGYSKLRIRRFI